MDKQFDELSKSLAEGVSRREALRKFGIGLAGILLASLGIQISGSADPQRRCWDCITYLGLSYRCGPTKPKGCYHPREVACSYCNASGVVCC